ncbi:Replication factor A protein 2 [Didymosphaeria variabile]|uniref:Replication factor A protein 2 n=1 Tax=Didymosphaeria variabile TaxID=1932322 RepID=A0A9W8XL04_9PLEO|nr:Replication factor A protein 2 [Didymosphaeria variabile]KAJ4353449.1 Replication factor A protein 2 [Didymosphaeria variabile]
MSYNNYETSYTSYGGGGGGGGGGFMPDGSQNSPSRGRENAQDTLRPVTIKQVLDAQPDGDDFKIDGNKISQLTFIGQIRNIATQTTNITYKLDDGTGSIEVKQWNDADAMETSPLKSKLIEGAYCRAWGKLKSFHDRRHVNAQIIRPVEDMNEVQYHLLEATSVHLYYTRGPPGASENAGGAAQANGAVQETGAAPNLGKVSKVAQQVYKFLQNSNDNNEGVHYQVISSELGLDTAEVAKAGDELLEGGLIYTTLDDVTWALLDPAA